ncbi:MAG: nuclear transport factor 2 family protein [Mycobacterium sp.]
MTPELTRRGARAGIVLMTTVLLLIAMIGGSATSSARTGQQERNTQVVRDAFALGVGDGASFYSILAEDVQWTVARAVEPRTYTSRAEFLRDGAGPILRRLDGPIRADVRQLIAEDDVVVAIWEGTATARDGRPYVNSYAWVMTMRDERVVRVTAYLDFVVLDELLARVG